MTTGIVDDARTRTMRSAIEAKSSRPHHTCSPRVALNAPIRTCAGLAVKVAQSKGSAAPGSPVSS